MDSQRKRQISLTEGLHVFQYQQKKKKFKNEQESWKNHGPGLGPSEPAEKCEKNNHASENGDDVLIRCSTESKKKENGNMNVSVDLGVNTTSAVSKKHKKKKKKLNNGCEFQSSFTTETSKRQKEFHFDGETHLEDHARRKKHKKKKETKCEHLHSSTDSGVDSEVSKKHKKRKHLFENEQQRQWERHFVEPWQMGDCGFTPKKKKRRDESVVQEESLLSSSIGETSKKQKIIEYKFNGSEECCGGQHESHSEENTKKKKHKKKHDDSVIMEVSKKHKKGKHKKRKSLLENGQQDGIERHFAGSEEAISPIVPLKKKKKKKCKSESKIKKELFSPGSTPEISERKKDVGPKLERSGVKKELFSPSKDHKNKKKHVLGTEERPFSAVEDDIELVENIENHIEQTNNDTTETEYESLHTELDLGEHSIKLENQSEKSFTDEELPRSPIHEKAKNREKYCRIRNSTPDEGCDSDEAEDAEVKRDFLLEAKVKKIKEEKRLDSAEEKKLSNLKVALPWPVPALHLIETRVAVRPTEQQRKAIEELDVAVKTGAYSALEDKQIRANWEEFCKMHNLPEDPKPFLNLVNPDGHVLMPTRERINFVRFLAHSLENRLLCSVFNRFRRLFQDEHIKTGRFTPEEDRTIIEYMQNSSRRTPYSDLATLLNRNKTAIEKRAQKLTLNGGSSVVKWDKRKIQDFLTHFVEVTNVADVEDLKDRAISTEEWRRMESAMEIPKLKLRNAWTYTIYPKVFIKRRVSTSQVKKCLIRILVERGEDDFKTINWNSIQSELEKEYEGFTGQKLNMLLQGMLNYHVPATKRRNLKECLHFLQEALKKGEIRGQKVRRLKVIDNREALM